MAEPTQILILSIPPTQKIEDTSSPAGKTWQEILILIRQSPGYKRLYWGRHIEDPTKVQLHIVRTLHQNNTAFLASPSYNKMRLHLRSLSPTMPMIRHALISTFSPSCKSLGKGAPVTGTAIYFRCTEKWDMAWAKWVDFVQGVPGFLGIAGGPVLEEVEGKERAFIALVGWESVAVHEAYHRTRHFREEGRRVLLDEAQGYMGYGHIAFSNHEEKGEGVKGKL